MRGWPFVVLAACSSFSATDPTPQNDAVPTPPGETFDADTPPVTEAGTVAPYVQKVLADKPVAYWQMDVESGLSVPDATGHGHDLVLVGAQGHTLGVAGISQRTGDHSIHFDGVTSGATALDSKSLPFSANQPFSIECWAALLPPDGGTNYFVHLLNYSTGAGPNRSGVLMYLAAGKPVFERDKVDAGGTYLGAESSIGDTQFHYFVGVYDGTQMSFWVDGVRVRSDASLFDLPGLSATFSVGYDQPNNAFRFAGSIDEVAIYDHPLSDDAIATHFIFRSK